MLRPSIARLVPALVLACAWLVPPAPAAAERHRSEMAHTPWLGLRFVQGEREAPLAERDVHTTEVRLRRRPFTLLLPVHGEDDVYMVCAWTDPTIWDSVPLDAPLADPDRAGEHCLGYGSGIADTEAGSGTLFLNFAGHMHLVGLRLGPDRERHAVYVSRTFQDGLELPIEEIDDPLYLLVFRDADGDGERDNDEYDYLVLEFGR